MASRESSEDKSERTIEVRGLEPDEDENSIACVFESTRIGGGEVQTVVITNGVASVTFKDACGKLFYKSKENNFNTSYHEISIFIVLCGLLNIIRLSVGCYMNTIKLRI